jgi:translation initiation factor IF-3
MFMPFRAAATASLLRESTFPTHKWRKPWLVIVPVRYSSRAPMPGSNHPRNRNIPHSIVQLADAEGRLGPPTSLSHLLASIDSKTHYIELVTSSPQPVVKIRNKKEQYHKKKAWNKRQNEIAASNVQKEIQMSWGVESGDLAHKLNKARKELEKGNRVEWVLAPKANQRIPSPAVMEARINDVAEKIAEFAREWLPRKFERGVAILYLKKLDTADRSSNITKLS